MAKNKVGLVFRWRFLSPVLAMFRLRPEHGERFSKYKAGQYISLHRDNCKIVRKIGTAPDGQSLYEPALDDEGNQKLGPVTHSYSISSAPFETEQENFLEFYVNLERDDISYPGKPVESLFLMDLHEGSTVHYSDTVGGDFTLEQRAAGFQNVLMIGTGTGLAPFAAMLKQLHHDTNGPGVQYTLIHANRRFEELGYHQELLAIEASRKFDFLYVPLVSRPSSRDWNDPSIGKGRASSLLRLILNMPPQKSQETFLPVLPEHIPIEGLQRRLDPQQCVILACGNPLSMVDMKLVADSNRIRFEQESW